MIDFVKSHVLIGAVLLLIVVGQCLSKFGINLLGGVPETARLFAYIALGAAYLALTVRGFVWVFVLRRHDLSYAYPMLALSYVLVLFMSALLFDEVVTIGKVAGSVLIVLGTIQIHLGDRSTKSDPK